jgi:hypothetical protein
MQDAANAKGWAAARAISPCWAPPREVPWISTGETDEGRALARYHRTRTLAIAAGALCAERPGPSPHHTTKATMRRHPPTHLPPSHPHRAPLALLKPVVCCVCGKAPVGLEVCADATPLETQPTTPHAASNGISSRLFARPPAAFPTAALLVIAELPACTHAPASEARVLRGFAALPASVRARSRPRLVSLLCNGAGTHHGRVAEHRRRHLL